ncbi:MAG: SulP family inorganic anion transporter [Actinomycetota bacterium]|nr:SulP family inorganic anion transporter [Actinomycetota bacterium]
MTARSLLGTVRRGEYERAWLRPDVVAGCTVAAMLVPQAMAYAELGGLPPSAGFRAALVALPIYALVGTSRHLGIGPEPGTAVLSAVAVAPLAAGDPDRYLALMAALAGLVGVCALVAGVLRLGFVADLLSKPVLVGYISGVGLTLLSSQIRAFTGVPIEADSFFPRVGELLTSLDEIDATTLLLGLATLVLILVLRWWSPAVPGALIGLALAIVVVELLDLEVAVVGEIDAAFPSFAVPDVSTGDLGALLPAAAGVALIGYTDNILTARSIAGREDYEIDANRELLALGAMNGAGAFGGGFPMSSSASRSFVPATIGSRSQLTSVVAFVAVVVFLLVGRSLLAEIPSTALAAVIVAAAIAVIDVEGFRRVIAISRIEAGLAALTCLAVVTTDLLYGVLFAVAVSVVIAVGRVARPNDAILGEGAGLDGWISIDDPRATPLEGLLVYRFDAPLFFANAEWFRQRVEKALVDNPGEERHIVLDFEGVGSIDTTAVDHLEALLDDADEQGLRVSIARANDDVLELLGRCGLRARLGEENLYPTINAAVAAFRRRPPEPADDRE